MGLPQKHGLDLKLGPDLAGGGPERIQAVVTNNTDIATSDIIAAMGAIHSGAKIKVLMVMTPYGDEEVWGQNKYKEIKDAKGETWGVASLAGAQRFNAQMAVQGLGLGCRRFPLGRGRRRRRTGAAGAEQRSCPTRQPVASRCRSRPRPRV